MGQGSKRARQDDSENDERDFDQYEEEQEELSNEESEEQSGDDQERSESGSQSERGDEEESEEGEERESDEEESEEREERESDEEEIEEEEERESDEEPTQGERDAEMDELEKEYLNLRNQEQNLLKNLKRHKDEDALKGQAVKNQNALWDKTLELRFLLQKVFSNSNKLPKEPVRSAFCDSNEAVNQAYSDLIDSSKQTLSCMLDLQEALLEKNSSVIQAEKGEDILNELKGDSDEDWLQIHKMHQRIVPFRNNAVDKWQRKTQVTTGATALKGKLNAFNQNISDQVAGYMRDPSRMIKRMQLIRSSVGLIGQPKEGPDSTKEGVDEDGDPELLDDSEFYQQLLKEFLELCDLGASELAFYALRKLQPKKRKVVDRRASKSRKIRYHVHEKIVNFMAPVPMTLPPMAPKLFDNLFGFGNNQSSPAV